MFGSKFASAVVASLVVLCVAAPVAAADTPKAEIGLSYSILHNKATTYPLGWVAAIDGNITNSIAIVGEVAGNYKTMTEAGIDLTLKEHTFLGGLKFTGRGAGSAAPFFQVLAGLGRFGAGAEGFSASVNVFAFQPGAGVDIKLGANSAVRLQGDYRLLRKNGENLNEFRVAVGVVFGVGKR